MICSDQADPNKLWLDLATKLNATEHTADRIVLCCTFVSDLDDVHCYSARAKPHTNPLDFRVNAFFYFLPSSQHAVSMKKLPQQSLATVMPAIDPAQFDDA